MRSFDELEMLWRQVPPAPRDRGRVELIVVRPSKGERAMPERVELSPALGVHGDRWSKGEAPRPEAQVTLMNARIGELVAHGQSLALFGDNFLVDLDLGEAALPAGTRLRLGTALVEISAHPHTGCKQYSARFGSDALRWVNAKQGRSERRRGVNCRVLEAGVVTTGDLVEVLD